MAEGAATEGAKPEPDFPADAIAPKDAVSVDVPPTDPLPWDALPPEDVDFPAGTEPDASSVLRYLTYTLSLPERAVRSATGLVGGAVRHSAAVLLPQAFQDSKTYSVVVRTTLDWLIDDVAGVKKSAPAQQSEGSDPAVVPPDDFVARKTVGSFVDLAGMATLHLSPVVILAVVSDLAYGSRAYLQELSEELKKKGVIEPNSVIDNASDLLAAVSHASGMTADAFNTPPLSVDGLKETIEQTRAAVQSIDAKQILPRAEAERMWNEMRAIAQRDGVSLLQVSTAMTLHTLGKVGSLSGGALSSARAAGNLFDRHILDHYRTALTDIRERGFYASLRETSGPYFEAVWHNFSSDRTTLTAELVSGRLFGRAYGAVRGWLAKDKAEPAPDDSSPETNCDDVK